jgi:hypothetical protein
MAQSTASAPRDQFRSRRDQFAKQEGLPFLKLLSQAYVKAACRNADHPWRQRFYTPWITPGIFLSQILSDDQSCDDAVARFQKFRYDQGLAEVSTETTGYCEARQRLPEGVFWDLFKRIGNSIWDHGRGGAGRGGEAAIAELQRVAAHNPQVRGGLSL